MPSASRSSLEASPAACESARSVAKNVHCGRVFALPWLTRRLLAHWHRSRTAVAPLERLKILMQVQGNDKVYKGVWQVRLLENGTHCWCRGCGV